MKLFYFVVFILIFSCGRNLIDGDTREFGPANLIYEPDSLVLDKSVDSLITSTKPHINEGSGRVTFAITDPVLNGLTINRETGVITATNELDSNVYYINVKAENFVDNAIFTNALTIYVK